MIWISSSVFMILLLAFLFPGRNSKEKLQYRSIRCFLRWSKKKGWNFSEWLDEKIIFKIWIILVCGNLLLTVISLISLKSSISRLERPAFGQGDVIEDLEVSWEDGNGNQGMEQLQIQLTERKLEEKEITEIFEKVKLYLKKHILAENETADYVCKNLYLPENLDEYPVEISWNSNQPSIVSWTGELGTEIPSEGIEVCLTATITLQEKEDYFEQNVIVYPPSLTWVEELLREVSRIDQENSWLQLPEQWQDNHLSWKRSENDLVSGLAILIFVCPVLLLMNEKQKFAEKKKRDREQMIQDYPEILSKLTLLLSAGMNLRKALERIASDYLKYYSRYEKRKAYEVLVEICKDLNCGVTEKQAYEKIGEKCDILQYRTLSSLLIQHLQKGNRDIERMLEEEARQAQELRQKQARILGEQASAKLVFPMLLMLVDVFVILIIPAWLSFSV